MIPAPFACIECGCLISSGAFRCRPCLGASLRKHPKPTPIVPVDQSTVAAHLGCEALHRATEALFARHADQQGCTVEEAALWMHHGKNALRVWRAAA